MLGTAARTPPRAVPPWRWRDQEAARSDRRDAPSSVPVTSQWHAHEGAGQAARYTMTSPSRRQHSRGSSHEGARDCSRAPGVMATTLRANAQELQVSTTVEENARDTPRPAWGSRAASSPNRPLIVPANNTLASALEKLQSALQKSRIDRATTRPTGAPCTAKG